MEMNGTVVINRPVDTVFAYVMDMSNDTHWRTGVDESGLAPGEKVKVGAIGYVRAGDKQADWKIVSYVPGESVEWEFLSGPFNGRGGYRLVPIDGGTEFTLLPMLSRRAGSNFWARYSPGWGGAKTSRMWKSCATSSKRPLPDPFWG